MEPEKDADDSGMKLDLSSYQTMSPRSECWIPINDCKEFTGEYRGEKHEEDAQIPARGRG